MIQMIGGVITLVLLILSRVFKANDEKAKEKEVVIKELKDALANRDVDAITAALSGLRCCHIPINLRRLPYAAKRKGRGHTAAT